MPTPPPSVEPNTAPSETMSALSCSSLPATMMMEPQKIPASLRTQSSHGPSTKTTTTTKRPNSSALARQKRSSWMQSSVVRRAAAVVDEEVAALCERSPFLNSLTTTTNNNNKQIALFHRLEIKLGKELGRGGFADVYTVSGFQVLGEDEDNDAGRLRKECQEKVLTSSGRPAYAIKFLSKRLLSKTREFQNAAIDMAVEAKYLAALSHPNIVQIRALTAGGTTAFRSGKHDDFFIIMDNLQETLEQRLYRWKKRHETGRCPPQQYFSRTLQYAHQIADALAYLHDKSIVYRDLKPQNLGFKERDVIQLFDFGLSRELPKSKGKSDRENLEDEETFHMSGVGTQRWMAPEIINTRRYNLKADVYSWSMVALSLFTWKKPFQEYSPEEHQKYVAVLGRRPKLIIVDDEIDNTQQSYEDDNHSEVIDAREWPSGVAELIEDSWVQDVAARTSMASVLNRMEEIIATYSENPTGYNALQNEVVLEFPSHFTPRHDYRHQPLASNTPDSFCGDDRSYSSSSYQELTMTSGSTSASTATMN